MQMRLQAARVKVQVQRIIHEACCWRVLFAKNGVLASLAQLECCSQTHAFRQSAALLVLALTQLRTLSSLEVCGAREERLTMTAPLLRGLCLL